ncbi:MAG: antibiotic biosynthesis monooxygenase [Acidimicrobiia bacterium]|nr:antibiotic biosynthesis monooxygenase [Acidimicrobiia bacterium]
MTILVTGTIDFDPAKRDDAIAAINDCMVASRKDDGCEAYVFSGDFGDPGRVHVSEQWTSQEQMDAHMATPHMAAFMGQMGAFGVTGASLTKWDGATPSKLM